MERKKDTNNNKTVIKCFQTSQSILKDWEDNQNTIESIISATKGLVKKFSLLENMQDETAQSNNNALGVLSNHMDAVHLIQKRLLDDIDNNYLLMLDCLAKVRYITLKDFEKLIEDLQPFRFQTDLFAQELLQAMNPITISDCLMYITDLYKMISDEYWRDQYILSKYKTASFKEKEKYFEQLSSRNEDSFLDYSYIQTIKDVFIHTNS